MQRDTLVHYLDDLLGSRDWPDFGPNGLQVEGAAEVTHLVTGVSACEQLFLRAARLGAQAILVHHGLFWKGQPEVLTGWRKRRLAALFANDLNLLAYHLPLDAHPELGNNVLAARGLGLVELAPFGLYQGRTIGYRGRFPEPIPHHQLVERCRALFLQEPLCLGHGRDPVSTVGIISGGAQGEVYQAIGAGLDAFLTGEASEWVTNVSREAGIHYLACGHYATERLGVRALGEHIAARFGLAVEFVEVHNPV
jgi:dinuclear metal center YbgI/SA1388 family protein